MRIKLNKCAAHLSGFASAVDRAISLDRGRPHEVALETDGRRPTLVEPRSPTARLDTCLDFGGLMEGGSHAFRPKKKSGFSRG